MIRRELACDLWVGPWGRTCASKGEDKGPKLASFLSLFQVCLLILKGLLASFFEILGSFFSKKLPAASGRLITEARYVADGCWRHSLAVDGFVSRVDRLYYHSALTLALTKREVKRNLASYP